MRREGIKWFNEKAWERGISHNIMFNKDKLLCNNTFTILQVYQSVLRECWHTTLQQFFLYLTLPYITLKFMQERLYLPRAVQVLIAWQIVCLFVLIPRSAVILLVSTKNFDPWKVLSTQCVQFQFSANQIWPGIWEFWTIKLGPVHTQ